MVNSKFQFNGFIVNKSLFELNKSAKSFNFDIVFKPSGQLDKNNSKFNLNLGVLVKDKNDNLKIEVESTAFFSFSIEDDKHLSNFLYLNAPAILFPYLRAYISSLSTLSGTIPVTLPTLNLVHLKEELERNTKEVDLS